MHFLCLVFCSIVVVCCLLTAILDHFMEHLLELDDTDIRTFIRHLPTMDINQIIQRAYNIMDLVAQQQLLDGFGQP